MPQATLNDFADKLLRSPILDAARREEAFRLSFSIPNPRDFAQEMLRRDWMTPYQANQIAQGKGSDLVLGQYVLLERLGEGGMGQVFKARQRNLDRIVALKLIRPSCLDNDRVIQRFMREMRAAGQLSHPNIVRAYDADSINGHWFIAMEFIDGSDLAREIKNRGPMPIIAACDYARQAALGLQHAHERGLVHRDIKPANLLLTHHADKPRVSNPLTPLPPLGKAEPAPRRVHREAHPWGMIKILDLGLVRLGESLTGSIGNLTQLNTVMGTPDFISPEQAMNSKASDIRSDLYSLGCTFYCMLTGQAPYPEGTLTQKLLQHQSEEPQPASLVRAARMTADAGDATAVDAELYVPKEVDAVLRKLMAKKPEQRFQTPGEVAIVLEGIIESLHNGAASPSPGIRSMQPALSRSTPPPEPIEVEMRSASAIMLAPEATPAKPQPAKPAKTRSRLMLAGLAATAVLAAIFVFRASRGLPHSSSLDRWKLIANRIQNKQGTPEEWRQELGAFRGLDPFGPHAAEAARVQAALPSPLDACDRSKIDAKLLAGSQPKELVAILGTARPPSPVRFSRIAISGDGNWLASAGDEGVTVRLWDLRSRETPSRLVGTGRAHAIAFHPESALLAVMADDGVKVWDVKTRTVHLTLEAGPKAALAGAFAPGGTTFAAAGADGIVRVWDLPHLTPKHTLQTNTGKVLSLAWAPDGKTLVWGGDNYEVHWAIPGQPAAEGAYLGCPGPVRVLAFAADGKSLLCGSGKKGEVKLCRWEAGKTREWKTMTEHASTVSDAAFSADGKWFATVSDDHGLKICDAATLLVKQSIDVRFPIHSVALAPDGRHIATGNANGTIYVLRTKGN
jgi:serine/threonine protein kinase/WD40 repeat protein